LAFLRIYLSKGAAGFSPPRKQKWRKTMKITSSSYSGSFATDLSKRSTQKQTAEGEKVSLFDQYLHLKVPKSKGGRQPFDKAKLTPYMQLMYDYKEWKKTQPEMDLPDSEGWTEENLAFLREHYSGELSAFEVVDAIETMYSMGAMSRNEHNWVSNSPLIALSTDQIGKVQVLAEGYDPTEFEDAKAWRESPLVGFFSLDDIFSWLEEFRKEEHLDYVTYEEAQRMGMVRPVVQ